MIKVVRQCVTSGAKRIEVTGSCMKKHYTFVPRTPNI